MYTNEELGFILYNNRSIDGVVSKFLPKINPIKLIKIEYQFDKCKSLFDNDDRMVEIDINELDVDSDDIVVTPEELNSLKDLIKSNIGNFNDNELNYLKNRGINMDILLKWNILGLSNIKDQNHLKIIGATCHPVLKKIMTDGIENGGILVPLFEDDRLVNCSIRKINSSKSLKYSLSCPDIPVWGLDQFGKGEEIWLTEGIFDMIALFELGKNSVSCSSGMWSGPQLYRLLEKNPSSIIIFSDNDCTGLRTSASLNEFFKMNKIPCKIVKSNVAKDPAEHYFEKNQTLDNISEIKVTKEMLIDNNDESFNFLKHMKNRKY